MNRMNNNYMLRGFSILFLIMVCLATSLLAQRKRPQTGQQIADNTEAQTVRPEKVLTSVRNDQSLPLSEQVKIYKLPAPTGEQKIFPLKPYPFENQIKELPFVLDPSLQDWQGANSSRTVLLSFDGLEVGDNIGGGGAPPDPNGDVGPNHYVQMTNSVYEIFDKAGNSVLGPFDINTLWAGFGGPCETNNNGDPIVLYDQVADRWFLSQFAVDDPNNQSICVACSQTPDPTGAYYRYQFNFTTDFPDYPKFGVWGNAYAATYRVFPNAGGFIMKAGALERNKMLAGNPAQMVVFSISALLPGTGADGFIPADLDGAAAAPGTPIPILGHQDDGLTGAPVDRLALFELTPDWNNTANSTFTGPVFLPTDPYDAVFAGGIPQPGTAQQLDILSHFTMFRLQARDFGTHMSMVTNHTVDVGVNHAGIRWYELRKSGGAWSIFQQGTYAPDNDHRWMGSIAMDGVGNIALGYSVSSSTTFPSIRFTGHTAGAAPGVMDVAEESIIAGTGSQTNPDRWGDYSMMTVDPVNDATFWYTTEYYSQSSAFNWKTRIGAFNLGPGVLPSGILVWEGTLGGQDYSGAYINTFLTNAGLTTQYTDVFPASLIGYDAVFLSFGNYGASGSNTVFDNTMAAAVQAYLEAGGKVYLEGGDALGFDQVGNAALLALFGLASAADGANNAIDGLQGQAGTLTDGMLFTASTQVNTNWIDTYTAGGGAIAFVESGYGNVAAQHSGVAGQKTFCFSYALAGLTDAAAPSTKDDLMAAIVNFLDLAPAAPDHLVWVPADVAGASAASGNNIFDALVANGRSAMLTDDLFEFGNDLSQYDAVWVVLGIYSNNHILGAGDPEAAALETYLANGGRIYLEGGDCFAYDPVNAGGYDINPWFDCTPVSDGQGDVAGLIGLNQLSAFTFDYTGENNFMDELSAIGSSPIWQNDANTDIHGLYNTGYGPGDGRAIGVVPSFGGMMTPTVPLDPETRIVKNFGSQEVQGTSSKTKVRSANKTARTVIKRFAYPSQPKVQRSAEKPLYKITPNGLELLANNQTDLMAAYLGLFESTANGQVVGSVNSPATVPQGGAFIAGVEVDMTNMPAPDALLGSFTATLTWDPACISYTGNSGILSGFTGFVNDGNAGNGVLVFNGAKATGQGGVVDILNVNFQAIGPVGSNCCLNLQFSAMAAAVSFTNLLPFLTVNGSCIDIVPACTPGLLGDINGDNAVNSLDALLMLSFDTGFPLPQPFLDRIAIGFGDATQDGLTNSTDALVTLSWEVGFPVPFPVGSQVCLPVAAALGKSTVAPAAQGAEVQAYAALNLSGQTLEVPVMVNMAKSGEKLGSYTMAMTWNPALLEFTGFDGGAAEGFGDPVVNDLNVKQGRLVAAHAYPRGAEGLVNVLNARFIVKGNAQTPGNAPVSLSFSAMAAAQTFTDLLPAVKVVDAPGANEAPASFALDNYPNPFNPATEIRYQLPEAADVQIVVYNVLGQKVQTLVSGKQQAGTYLLRWEGKNDQNQQVPSGMYFLRMKAGKFTANRKLLLMK